MLTIFLAALAVLSRPELGALLMLGVTLFAVLTVAACAVPVLDAVRRWVAR